MDDLARSPVEEARFIKSYFNHLFGNSIYLQFRDMWKTIRDKQLPWLGHFEETADASRPGRKKDAGVLDGEAWRANLVFAGGMKSGLTPQSVNWFDLTFKDENINEMYAAKRVLEARRDVMLGVLAGSTFYNATHNNYMELAFGQAPMGLFLDPFVGAIFESYPIGSYAYDVDDKGIPCTFAHKQRMNAWQIKSKFRGMKLPERIEQDINENKGFTSSYVVCWLVRENPAADQSRIWANYKPYRSYYWLQEERDEAPFIHIGGFDEFPIAIARYQVIGSQAYGIGPGWYADSDTRMFYRMLREAFINMELFSRPPLQAPGTFKIDMRPAGITRNEIGARVEQLFNTTPIFQQIFEVARGTKEAINRAYNTNLFNMLDAATFDKTGRTAYEMALRNQEKMQLLGPVVERQNSEYLNVILERLHAMLERAGVLPEYPDDVVDAMQGEEVEIKYVSPLAQAAKASRIQPMEQLMNSVAQAAQFDPNIVNILDTVEYVYNIGESVGAPIKLLRSREQYQKILEQQAQAAQAQEEMQAMLAAAPAAKDVAQATQIAANTQDMVESGANPSLDAMLSGIGGGGI